MKLSISVLGLALLACSGVEGNTDSTSDSGQSTDSGEFQDAMDLTINELLGSAADDGSDWIEIHNASDFSADLSGMGLSDSMDDKAEVWSFPEGTSLSAGGFLLIWADEGDDSDGELHANFKISKDGETLWLLDRSDNTLDTVTAPEMAEGVSYARSSDGDGAGEWALDETPTPDASNN